MSKRYASRPGPKNERWKRVAADEAAATEADRARFEMSMTEAAFRQARQVRQAAAQSLEDRVAAAKAALYGTEDARLRERVENAQRALFGPRSLSPKDAKGSSR